MDDLLSLTTISLTRNSGDYDADGKWVTGADTPITIKGNIQPVWRQSNSGIISQALAEGIQIEDIRIVYTRDDVRTFSTTSKAMADRITIDGLTYYAYRMRKWTYYGTDIDHNEVFFVREQEGRA